MFINVCERYGDYVPADLADYQELNPAGTFRVRDTEAGRAIVEELKDGRQETVAVEV